MGAGAKVRLTPAGRAAVTNTATKAVAERMALLRARREPNDERVVACLCAAGLVPLQAQEIRQRTGLGPRVLKAALQRLRRDGWVIERRGAFATSPALVRLLQR